jgi:membrane-associated phospholipid phosphatase
MGELSEAVDAKISHLIIANGPAEAALLGLLIAAAVFGVGRVYRDRIPVLWSTAVQAVGLLAGVVVLALQVSTGGWLTDVDHSITGWLVAHRNPALAQVALTVTNAFGPAETAATALVFAVAAGWGLGSVRAGATILATVGGAALLCATIKLLVARVRPPVAIQATLQTDYSFPSGHVTGIAALAGMIAVTVGLRQGRAVRRALTALAALAVSAVALSRLYLGMHWWTDVLAGALLGAAVLTVGAAVLRALIDPAPPRDEVRQAVSPVTMTTVVGPR